MLDKQLKEEMKQEAIKRLGLMRAQGLMPCVFNKFKKKKSDLYFSEYNGLGGALFYLTDETSVYMNDKPVYLMPYVKRFEEEYDALVYHATVEKTPFGICLDLFYVSSSKEEWNYDTYDIVDKRPYVYVYNLTIPEFSEFGSISYDVVGGGLVRTDYML